MHEMCRRAAVIMCLVVSETKKKEKKHQGSGRFDGCTASLSGRWEASSGPGVKAADSPADHQVIKKTSHLVL